mmetsp:Transcript_2703/g.8199  ORF Transcript_2703/g.8199 Transcript_2703/m.8199 type:complete len:156 (+) Transcript_2703:695-1162(+)
MYIPKSIVAKPSVRPAAIPNTTPAFLGANIWRHMIAARTPAAANDMKVTAIQLMTPINEWARYSGPSATSAMVCKLKMTIARFFPPDQKKPFPYPQRSARIPVQKRVTIETNDMAANHDDASAGDVPKRPFKTAGNPLRTPNDGPAPMATIHMRQ